MLTIDHLNSDFLDPLEKFRHWVFSDATQDSLARKIEWQRAPLHEKNLEEAATAIESLKRMDHTQHDGYPPDQYGVNLNYNFLQKERRRVSPEFFEEIRARDHELDDQLQSLLGARFCALKMYYPANGYIAWHTNWNVPGYNIIFTYSPTGDGYWRHINPEGATSIVPEAERLVHIPDRPGWHCKVGYFGRKDEPDRVVWHSAFTREPRLTVSYVIFEKNIWENMVEELSEGRGSENATATNKQANRQTK